MPLLAAALADGTVRVFACVMGVRRAFRRSMQLAGRWRLGVCKEEKPNSGEVGAAGFACKAAMLSRFGIGAAAQHAVQGTA